MITSRREAESVIVVSKAGRPEIARRRAAHGPGDPGKAGRNDDGHLGHDEIMARVQAIRINATGALEAGGGSVEVSWRVRDTKSEVLVTDCRVPADHLLGAPAEDHLGVMVPAAKILERAKG